MIKNTNASHTTIVQSDITAHLQHLEECLQDAKNRIVINNAILFKLRKEESKESPDPLSEALKIYPVIALLDSDDLDIWARSNTRFLESAKVMLEIEIAQLSRLSAFLSVAHTEDSK